MINATTQSYARNERMDLLDKSCYLQTFGILQISVFSREETLLNLPPNQWGVTEVQPNMAANDGSWFDLKPSPCSVTESSHARFLALVVVMSVAKCN